MEHNLKVPEAKRPALLLMLVVAAGLALSLYLYSGPSLFYDDSTYIYNAHLALQGNAGFLSDRFSYGFLKILQLALSFSLFGYGNVQAVIPTTLEYVATIAIVFFSALELFKRGNSWFAGAAALVAATAPFMTGYATRTLPDIPLGMMVALAFYLFIRSRKSRGKALLPALFGFATAATIYMNEEGFIFIAATAISLLALYILKGRLRGWALPAGRGNAGADSIWHAVFFSAGLALGIIIYLGVFYFAMHDALFPFQHYVYIGNSMNTGQEAAIIFRPFIYGTNTNPDIYPPGAFFLFSIAGGIVAMMKREKGAFYVSFLYFLFLAYMLVGSSSPGFFLTGHNYGPPIPIVTRMLAIMILPISILCAYALLSIFKVVKSMSGRKLALAVAAAVFASLVLLNVPEYAFLKAANSGISQETQALHGVAGYVMGISGGNAAAIYIDAPSGFPWILSYALEYASGFDSRLSLLPINASGLAGGSAACENPSPNSFLVSTYLQKSTTMELWLGQNCTATLLRNFTSTIPSWDFNFALYSIKAR